MAAGHASAFAARKLANSPKYFENPRFALGSFVYGFYTSQPVTRFFTTGILFSGIVAIFYGWPHLLGWLFWRLAGPWWGCVFFGDLVGCLFLFLVLKKRWTGAMLYLGLTGADAYLFSQGLITERMLLWMQDLVPALVAASHMSGEIGSRIRAQFDTTGSQLTSARVDGKRCRRAFSKSANSGELHLG